MQKKVPTLVTLRIHTDLIASIHSILHSSSRKHAHVCHCSLPRHSSGLCLRRLKPSLSNCQPIKDSVWSFNRWNGLIASSSHASADLHCSIHSSVACAQTIPVTDVVFGGLEGVASYASIVSGSLSDIPSRACDLI